MSIGIGNKSPRILGVTRWRRDSKSQGCETDEGTESELDRREHGYKSETKGVGATQSLGESKTN